MARTQTKGNDVGDGSIARVDINTTTTGSAVITKIVEAASTGIMINASSGADAGTGDVSLKVDTAYLDTLYAAKAGGTVSAISVNTSAVAGTLYILTASLTLTLPAAPAAGDEVMVSNMSGTTTAIIARNSLKIMGLAEDLTINDLNVGITLKYTNATYGWLIF